MKPSYKDLPEYEDVDVMLAVNDDNGNHTGRLIAVEIPDWITLEGPIFEPRSAPVCRVVPVKDAPGLNWLLVRRKRFPIISYSENVGNLVWDCAWMARHIAAGLLNHLRKMDLFDCTEAVSDLYEKWQDGDKLTWADLCERTDAPDGATGGA